MRCTALPPPLTLTKQVLDFDRTLIDGTPLDPPMVLRPHMESFLMVRMF